MFLSQILIGKKPRLNKDSNMNKFYVFLIICAIIFVITMYKVLTITDSVPTDRLHKSMQKQSASLESLNKTITETLKTK